jgi:RNA polymerase sigma-70 factor (ECF subfamily)
MSHAATHQTPEAKAFAHHLSHLQGPLFGFVYGMVGDREQSLDIVQDVFVDAWRLASRSAPPFTRDLDEPGARRWLFHAAYCRSVTVTRRARVIRWETLDSSTAAAHGQSYEQSPFEDRIVEGEVLRQALTALAAEDAACVLLSVVQAMSSTEIAHVLGITPEVAKKRVTRAKQRLRAAYAAQESGTEAYPQ